MPLRRVRYTAQTADLAAQIHTAYDKGFSKAGAIRNAADRYPELKVGTIRAMVDKQYGERKIIDDVLNNNFGQFTDVAGKFGCKGKQIKLTTYYNFVDEETGERKHFWADIIMGDLKDFSNLSAFFNDVFGQIYGQILSWEYNPPEIPEGTKIKDLIKSGSFEIKGFECL